MRKEVKKELDEAWELCLRIPDIDKHTAVKLLMKYCRVSEFAAEEYYNRRMEG